ncbi:MAG: hypothetical protein CMA06_05240 [Euryarchaeota archaeon]|nr:hypothetical protein [Euryarchaeota archaeon]
MRMTVIRRERLKPLQARTTLMRTAAMLLVLMLVSPVAAAIVDDQEVQINLEIDGEPILPTYSLAVQLAFDRVEELDQYSEDQLAETDEWLVVTQIPLEKQIWSVASPEKVKATSVLRGAYIWTFDEPLNAISDLKVALELGQIESFSPLVERQQHTRDNPNDPELGAQWHLDNYGQTSGLAGEDINATDIWDHYRGEGVIISIVDDGLDHEHPDIEDNYDPTYSYDWCNDDSDPAPSDWNGHGTAAAGVAAAVGNNSLYVSGAAWEATLAGSTLIACWAGDSTEADALSFENDDIDIYSNSWGPSDDGSTLAGPGPLTLAAFEEDAYWGRGGLGNSITWAAGNGLGSDDNANKDGYANSRFTIAVTAINHEGDQSYYAEPGANILVAAHSNGDGEGITTTDITGSGGYNGSGNVTHTFGGTSSATPLAAGVIALMYDANQDLTWRDVQEILLRTARMNDPNDSSWNTNGAGHDVSHKYGFGAVDAGAAVSMALNWTTLESEMNATFGPYYENYDIPDGNSSWSEFPVDIPLELSLESIDVIVDINHTYRGDLDIVLVSPDGTESWLAESNGDANDDFSNWLFNTVHHWGESSLGEWILKVRDAGSGDNGTLNSWQLIFHGVDIDFDHDDDGLSDENETLIWGTDPYDADSDDDGLSDYDEVMTHGTDPLMSDSDTDGLTDEQELNTYGTDALDSDSDDDGLSDGVEVNYWGTDPLDYDADADNDLFYHFQDCNDNNPNVNPGTYERLNGIDDDCDEVTDEGFNFTDRDSDGLKDWPEYHVHGTDFEDDDTDDDGLTDGVEVNTHGSDPLTYDPDADSDGFHWFLDCDDEDEYRNPALPELLDDKDNDCDLIVDDGFWDIDSDSDGLDDYDEFHNVTSDPYDGDTDDDGLPDGLEVNTYQSNPLWADPDDDGDGWYWFQDCQDDDSERAPFLPEMLDSKDNDCDDEIDEDFHARDSDNDGLGDYDEYHNLSTDPEDADSDDDGMTDGKEILETKSNPLVFDHDRDEDGFYAFEDCEDLIESINPDASETWNGWDDDCNDVIDDSLIRSEIILTSPETSETISWDSVNDTLRIDIHGIPIEVSKTVVWEMEGITLAGNMSDDGQTLILEAIDCESKDWDLAVILCKNGDALRYLNVSITDSGFVTQMQWIVDVEVYIPPPTILESLFAFFGSTVGIVVMLLILLSVVGGVSFAGMKMRENKMVADAYAEFRVNQRPPGAAPEHRGAELPSAPDLSALLSQHSQNAPAAVEEIPMLGATAVAAAPVVESNLPPMLGASAVAEQSIEETEDETESFDSEE